MSISQATVKEVDTIRIEQWNCNSLNNKHKLQIKKRLEREKIDIFCINETKLCEETKNYDLENYFTQYKILRKNRNCSGGGVAMLIRKDIAYEVIEDLDYFEFELVAIKVTFDQEELNLINIYIPPRNCGTCKPYLSDKFFEKLKSLKRPYIMCGDLNSHWHKTNKRGRILKEMTDRHNLIVFNDKSPTHCTAKSKSIIDLFIGSSEFKDKKKYERKFKVNSSSAINVHHPILLEIKIPTYSTTTNQQEQRNKHETTSYNFFCKLLYIFSTTKNGDDSKTGEDIKNKTPKNYQDSENIQDDLNKLVKWLKEWRRLYNPDKSKVKHIDQEIEKNINYTFFCELFYLVSITNDVHELTTHPCKQFADDSKKVENIKNELSKNYQDSVIIQDDLNKLVKWLIDWRKLNNPDKSKVKHIGQKKTSERGKEI